MMHELKCSECGATDKILIIDQKTGALFCLDCEPLGY